MNLHFLNLNPLKLFELELPKWNLAKGNPCRKQWMMFVNN